MRGRSDIPEDIGSLPHKAAPLLARLRLHGAPVVLASAPWSPELLHKRFKRGPHKSADDYAEFLQEEFLEFVQKGFWMLLPWEDVKDLPGLRLSPIGVVPQRDRRPRIIVDYSFFGINEDTIKLAPRRSMQFGKANERLWKEIVEANPAFGPLRMHKVDISDGFYRVPLSTSGILKLGVCLPPFDGMPPLVAFPLVLPMGWAESPPYFCSFTETACDLANAKLRRNIRVPPHHLDALAGEQDDVITDPPQTHGRPMPKSHRRRMRKRPIAYVDVFVDDFLGVTQDHPSNPSSNQRSVLNHSVDSVFRPNDVHDDKYRQEPNSKKKLKKGDSALKFKKRSLGWDYQVLDKTLLLAPHRSEKVLAEINQCLAQRRVGQKSFESLIGQLRSLVPGVPGSEGQFSLLQAALREKKDNRVRLNETTHHQLNTFVDLLADTDRPTYLEELVAGDPHNIGACDAAKPGAGGVWFTEDDQCLLWRLPFPEDIQQDLVSFKNPRGRITNSDLELAGTILQQDVLAEQVPIAGETTHNFCDNTPTVAWRTKGSATTTKVTASLLRYSALQRRRHRSKPMDEHISGDANRMGDDASRKWELSDPQLLTYFDRTYPQKRPWKLCHPTKQTSSAVMSLLCPTKSPEESLQAELLRPPPRGGSGANSVSLSSPTRDSAASMTQSLSSSSSVAGGETAVSPLVASRSALEQLRTPFATWARRFPCWGP